MSTEPTRADFLKGFDPGSVEHLGWRFANAQTEKEAEDAWNDLIARLAEMYSDDDHDD